MKSIFRMPGGEARWGWKAAILIVGTMLFGIVLNGVLFILWALKPAAQNMMEKKQLELHQSEFKARRLP